MIQNTINECYRLKLLWLTLTQVQSSCEIEFLPVYNPSEEEKHDPKLYANNVRRLMAKYVEFHA
jgi:lysophosphatidylcholine acyltransferase/lyso-PAF acetyltransferase